MAMMQRKKKTNARGASRKVVQPSRKSVSLRPLLPVVMIMVVAGFVFSIYQGIGWLQAQPVERVVMTGEFNQVDKQQLTEQIKPLLRDGFVAVDLLAIRERLEQTPWIFNAQVERKWPGTLLIKITEQRAIARWGQHGFLNHRGQLFIPEKIAAQKNTPQLSGPENSEEQVMQQFAEIAEVLSQQDLALAGLSLSKRDTWQASLANGVELIFGREQIMEKVHRFVRVYQQQLKSEFARVERVDLRYNHGLAVAWRKLVDADQTEQLKSKV